MRNYGRIIIASAMASAGPAAAEPALFSNGPVPVIDAQRFIDDARGGRYVYGSHLQMTVNVAEARRLAGVALQARIFPLGPGDILPRAWKSFPPCDVYYTLVRPIGRGSRGVIDLGALNDLSWLLISTGGIVETGRFLIVFEARRDDHRVFRLNAGKNDEDKAAYFKRALRIEVSPSERDSGGDISRREQTLPGERAQVLRIVNQNTRDWTCYRFETAAADAVQLAGLVPCPEPGPAAAATTGGG